MTGTKLYIDGIDIQQQFGVVVPSGGFDDLFIFPAMKEPPKNDWPEHDGIEVNLKNPVLNAKEVTLSFVFYNPSLAAPDFIHFLSSPGYRRFSALGCEWMLRYWEAKDNTVWDNASAFSLVFIDDYPLQTDPGNFSPNTRVENSGFRLDNIAFNSYGVVVMEGTDELLMAPPMKKNLLRSQVREIGQQYDTEVAVYSHKEVAFKCCLIAANMDSFWTCYDAFFRDLTAPDERLLTLDRTGEDYPCYYKETSNFKIEALYPVVAVTFTLTLVFTVLKVAQTEYILTAEGGEYLILEDDSDGDVYIDLSGF